MQGKIIKGIAGFYYVQTEDKLYECKAKGIFRNKKMKPLVGDNVEIDILDEAEQEGNITKIYERHNELIRPAVSNVDQALIIFAAKNPKPNYNLLDRFLMMMEKQDVPVIVCFNKVDLAKEKELKLLEKVYENCGHIVRFISVKEEEGIDEFIQKLEELDSKYQIKNRTIIETTLVSHELCKISDNGWNLCYYMFIKFTKDDINNGYSDDFLNIVQNLPPEKEDEIRMFAQMIAKNIIDQLKNNIIPAIVFENIFGEDIDYVVDGMLDGDLSYHISFNGTNLKNIQDFNYRINYDSKYSQIIKNASSNAFILDFEFKGNFPGKINFETETTLTDGQYGLYYYDNENQKIEYVKEVEVIEGKTTMTLMEGHTYFISEKLDLNTVNTLIKTGDQVTVLLPIVGLLMGIMGIYFIKKKTNKTM